jgi:hypothetical protein
LNIYIFAICSTWLNILFIYLPFVYIQWSGTNGKYINIQWSGTNGKYINIQSIATNGKYINKIFNQVEQMAPSGHKAARSIFDMFWRTYSEH